MVNQKADIEHNYQMYLEHRMDKATIMVSQEGAVELQIIEILDFTAITFDNESKKSTLAS